MVSFNLANIAISSAIAVTPLSFNPPSYDEIHIQPPQVEQSSEAMSAKMREALFMAEKILAAFYQVAAQDPQLFDQIEAEELSALFDNSKQLLASVSHFKQGRSGELVQRFSQTLAKTDQLYQSYEYKKEADRVLLPRANGPIAASFDHTSSEEEIRKFIFG